MATTTPNYGWPVPTSTDYVKDGALAIENLGDAIDATVFGLGGSGLALIKTQTVGTAVTSVTVTGAFSATYQAYKIIIAGGVGSTNQTISLKMGTASTGHDSALIYTNYTGSVPTYDSYSNTATWPLAGYSNTSGLVMNVELVNPFLSSITRFASGFSNDTASGVYNGRHNSTTSFTDFTVAVAGTMTGGTIRVYGYANS